MTYNEIVSEVSEELGLPRNIVNLTYKAYWRAVREHIESLPLKQDPSDEEFIKLQPNVNIPSLGKLYVTLKHLRGINKNVKYYKELNSIKDAEDRKA